MLPPRLPLSDANTDLIRDVLESMARARRDALLQEIAYWEALLGIHPTTKQLRSDWRDRQACARTPGDAETEKLKD